MGLAVLPDFIFLLPLTSQFSTPSEEWALKLNLASAGTGSYQSFTGFSKLLGLPQSSWFPGGSPRQTVEGYLYTRSQHTLTNKPGAIHSHIAGVISLTLPLNKYIPYPATTTTSAAASHIPVKATDTWPCNVSHIAMVFMLISSLA